MTASEIRFEALFPEPLRYWIVYAPRRWSGPEGWWLDLARDELVDGDKNLREEARSDSVLEMKEVLDDVTYLPPVAPARNWWRQELRSKLVEVGAVPIVQYFPGEEIEAGGGVPVIDLTPALLPPRLGILDTLPSGVYCSWPLIPGLTTEEALCRSALERIAAAGVTGVLPSVPALSSVVRRKLGELAGRQGYQELFHGAQPEVVRFARWASAAGLQPFLERPACGHDGRALKNRRIATRLHLIGELLQKTGGSIDESLSFYRAGRWADREPLDIEDLVRAGNLGLVRELTAANIGEIESLVAQTKSSRFESLWREYHGPGERTRES